MNSSFLSTNIRHRIFSLFITCSALVIFFCIFALSLRAEDWPQWQGVRRDSVWNETGLIEKFSAGGPKVLWHQPIKIGYAGPAVANGRVYVTDFDTDEPNVTKLAFSKKKIVGKERVLCLDAKSGEQIWKHEYDVTYEIQYPGGPRCTPTVHDGLVYTLGAEGDLRCLTADKGELKWSKNFAKDFNAKTPIWGFTSHPLVDGDLLYVLPGGKAGVAALDRKTGETRWSALPSEDPGYAPPTIIDHAGKKLLLIWQPDGLSAVDPANGKVFWTLDIKPDYKMPVMSPRPSGNKLFVSAVEHTSAMINLTNKNDEEAADIVWRGTPKNSIASVNSAPFIQDGYVYGTDVQGEFRCCKLEDGERMWETFLPTAGEPTKKKNMRSATAFIVKNGERFFIMSETGDLIIAKLTPEKYDEISRTRIIAPTGTAWNRPLVWSHPAFANKCIFARNDEEIVCVSLGKE